MTRYLKCASVGGGVGLYAAGCPRRDGSTSHGLVTRAVLGDILSSASEHTPAFGRAELPAPHT